MTKEPLDDVTQFSSDAEELHATMNVKNMRAGGEFRFRWKRGTEVLTTLVFTVPVDLHDNWVEGFIEPTEPIPPGDDYSVEVLFDDSIVGEKSFRVVK